VEPIGLLGFFVSAASELRSLVGAFLRSGRENSERVARYFDDVASCLQEVAERVEAGDAPRDTCARLAVYAEQLGNVIGGSSNLRAWSDASVEEMHERLTVRLELAMREWAVVDREEDPHSQLFDYAVEDEAAQPADEDSVQVVTDEITARARSGGPRAAQPVWDAAGEFRALASTLRAR
jgi:hypothetical protein